MTLRNNLGFAIAMLALAASLPATAIDDPASPGAPASVPQGILSDPGAGADLGTGWNILPIPAAAFTPFSNSSVAFIYANGYIEMTAGGSAWAPVSLPSGAGIAFLNLYAFDGGSNDVLATLRRFPGYGSIAGQLCLPLPCTPVPPSSEDIVSVSTVGSPGYIYKSSNQLIPPHTVNNNVAYGGGAQYAVVVQASGANSFKGVDIWWKRQISPAPGTASFTDVPTSAQFFAEIEAMKASGVTSGCTASQFCPDGTVTRRQMAAFFARALGLYWQY